MPFGRKRRLDRSARERGVAPEVEDRHHDDEREATTGPYDVSDAVEDGLERIDFGPLQIPKSAGNDLRVSLDANGRVVSVSVHRDGSAMQIGAYAAPRDGSIWTDLWPELVQTITSQGGRASQTDGPFGPELAAELAPSRTGAGSRRQGRGRHPPTGPVRRGGRPALVPTSCAYRSSGDRRGRRANHCWRPCAG
ncbi:MAG: DUF3710 domain-containing protein [Geodermatophilaceae bacterium]